MVQHFTAHPALLALLALIAAAALASPAAQSATLAPALSTASSPKAAAKTCPALLQHTVLRLQDEKLQSLCQYSG